MTRRRGWPASLTALQHSDFRLLWLGQLVSNSGSMMQSAAILWHVALLAPEGQKGLALGLVGLTRVVPIVALSLLSGVIADAHDRRRVMYVTQVALTIVAAGLAALTWSGRITLGLLYALSALGAAATSFDGPARQALIPRLVPREHFPNAIGLNTIMFQAASVLGPALAGIVIAAGGPGFAYALNAVSFLAVIAALLGMRLPGGASAAPGERSDVSLRAALEGLRFTFSQPLIRSTMLLDFFATFFSSATALLPIFAQDVLRVGPTGYGALYAAPAVGALLAGGLMVPFADRIEHRGRTLLWAVIAYGIATVVFGLSTTFLLTFLCLAATGAADTVSMVLRNIIRQLATPDSLRGRMTSVNMMFFMGGPQLGELEAGLVAQGFGAPISVVTGGLGCLVATAWTAWRTPQLRAYRRDPAPVPVAPTGTSRETPK